MMLLLFSVDLHLFYEKVASFGGYEGCVLAKGWKAVHDELGLGANPGNNSASAQSSSTAQATSTRRNYEK